MRPTNEARMWGAMDSLLDVLRAVTMRPEVTALLTVGERSRIAKYAREYSEALKRCNAERGTWPGTLSQAELLADGRGVRIQGVRQLVTLGARLTPGASSGIAPAKPAGGDSRGKSAKRAKTKR